jgi:hypothetical protein
MNWLKIHPGVKNCPVTTSSQAAQYVAISNQGKFDIKYGDDWGIACHPDMSKLTQL